MTLYKPIEHTSAALYINATCVSSPPPQHLNRQLENTMTELLAMGVTPEALFHELSTQNVEIVLTGEHALCYAL